VALSEGDDYDSGNDDNFDENYYEEDEEQKL